MFNDCLRDPLAFQTSLLCVSSHLALLKRSKEESSLCAAMHVESMRMINARLADSEQSVSNATLAAVARVALFEVGALVSAKAIRFWFVDMYAAKSPFVLQAVTGKSTRVHMDGMEKMIALRGGLEAMKDPNFGRLPTLIMW